VNHKLIFCSDDSLHSAWTHSANHIDNERIWAEPSSVRWPPSLGVAQEERVTSCFVRDSHYAPQVLIPWRWLPIMQDYAGITSSTQPLELS
jgi:hypothetical protein